MSEKKLLAQQAPATHTPGPWLVHYRPSVREWWIGMSPREGSVTYCGKSFGFDREQEEANARLIAAAPELLEALEQIAADPLSVSQAELEALITRAKGGR